MSQYLVQVHVIQALNLIPTSDTNTAIPVVEVSCWGEKKQSKKGKDKTLNPFWDKNFNFQREGVDLDEGEHSLKITVYDADTWFSNDVIGEFVVDLSYVYKEEPGHEYYRKWMVLTKGEDEGEPCGFLKASILILNVTQGDSQPPREEEDPFADPATDNADDLEAAMLKPPNLRKDGYLIHCHLWEAQDLPIMDMWGTVDPFLKVGFAGKQKIATETFEQNQNPKFNTKITLKVGARAPTDLIILELLDKDLIFDELISNKTFSFKRLIEQGGEMAPRWFPLYGHAEEPDLNEVLKACYKRQMNEPTRTRYVGRLLAGFKAEYMDEVKLPDKNKEMLTGGPVKPREVNWTLRFDLYQGASLDEAVGWFEDLIVEVEWGNEIRSSGMMHKDEHGIACWFEPLEEIVARWPEIRDPGDFPNQGDQPKNIDSKTADWGDWDQLPVVVVRLLRDAPLSQEAVAELVLHPKDIPQCVESVVSTTSSYRPKWHLFEPVKKKTGKLAIDIPTFLQFRIGLNSDYDPAGVREPVRPVDKKAYVLRSHIYQARGLAAADRTGTSDPYTEIQCGNYRKTTRRNEETLCPLWYETLTGRIFMPPKVEDLSQAPMINVAVWDWEEGLLGFSSDTIIGRTEFEISNKIIVNQWEVYKPRKPKWQSLYDIIDGKKIPAGEILISFDIMHPNLSKEKHHKLPENGSLIPFIQFEPMILEYSMLGLRDLEPLPGLFSHTPVSGTKIRIKCGFAEWEDVVDYEWINTNKRSIYTDEDLMDRKQKYLSLPMMQTQLLPGVDEPNGTNPHYGMVGYLKFNYPVDRRYVPNVVVEVRDGKDRLIGMFDQKLSDVLAEQGVKVKGVRDEHLKLALERNGIDPAAAVDKGANVDGAEVDMDEPEVEGESGDDDETDDEAEAQKIQDELKKRKREPDNTNPLLEDDRPDEDAEDHEPCFGYDGPYDDNLKHLPYNRYLIKRQAPVAFNPFSLTFDRRPKLVTSGVFKGRFRVLKPMEIPGKEFTSLVNGKWGSIRGEPDGELGALAQFGSAEQILEWSDPDGKYPIVDLLHNKKKYATRPQNEHPLFYIGIDYREDVDVPPEPCCSNNSDDEEEEESDQSDISDIDETEHERVPTTPLERGGEVIQWYWDTRQEEWEETFSPKELVCRTYVYNAYYLVGQRGNDTNPTLKLSIPSGAEMLEESYPPSGGNATAWPMVLRTLAPNFRHTFSDVAVFLPGAGVATMTLVDRDEGIFTTTETEIGYTKFDIEDLAYDNYFATWKDRWEYSTWPTEQRSLASHTSRAPMGKVKMFVQVLDMDVAQKHRPMNIKGPGPMDFELRLTVMDLKDVRPPPDHEGEEIPTMQLGFLGKIPCFPCLRGPADDSPPGVVCCPGGLNIQVAATAKWCFPEAEEDRCPSSATDSQRCVSFENMSANYNWRMVLPVTLPCKFHFIQLNVYSTKFLGLFGPDAITENVFNLKAFFDRALDAKGRKPITIQLPAEKGGKWINLTHPKRGEETMAQLSVHMELVSKELSKELEQDDCLEGADAWDQVTTWPTRKLADLSDAQKKSKKVIAITKPDRPPVDFWPFNLFAWGRWCIYRHYWTVAIVSAISSVIVVCIGVAYLKAAGMI